MSEYKELSCLAYDLRKKVVEMVVSGKGGHIGGDMSVIDVLVALYFKEMNISPENMDDPDRDRFVMSKGHSVEAYYAVLAAKGFFPMEEVIEKFFKFGSPYIGHPNNKLPGIEMNSGSLGHGLPVCVGMALAGKMDKKITVSTPLWVTASWQKALSGRAQCPQETTSWTTSVRS